MEAKRPLSAVALASLMIISVLAVLAPPAQANHGCSFNVGTDASHAPANTWTTHNHPRWTFNVNHCRVHYWGVSTSWGGYFETGAGDYHPTLGSGQYSISVRALYSVDAYNNYWHCHASIWGICISWHYHSDLYYQYYWSGFVGSSTVKIDITPPNVDISSITGPYVDNTYLTSDTAIHLSASDAHSGIASVQTAQDDGAWATYQTGGAKITGADGQHLFRYRATDNVGLITAKSRTFILDNTAPVISILHPTPNSLNVDDVSAETCTDNVRITDGGETVAEAPELPETPTVPVDQTIDDAILALNGLGVPGIPSETDMLVPPIAQQPYQDAKAALAGQLPSDLPDAERPSAPGVVDEGPDACTGHVLSTLDQSVGVPGAPAVPGPGDVETPELPEEVPEAPSTPDVPEVPEAPVDHHDILPPTLANAVDGVLAQVPGVPGVPGAPGVPTQGEARSELESAIGPIPVEDPEVPASVDVAGTTLGFASPVVLTGVVEMSANVDDAIVGTQLVEFIVDGVVRDAQSHGDGDYAWSWDTTSEGAGEHSFAIRATDRLGNVAEFDFTVIVIATTQEGVEATAAATQADVDQAAVEAQATAAATAADAQATVDGAPAEVEATAAATQADAESRATIFQGYVTSHVEDALPDEVEDAIPSTPDVPLP